LHLAVYDQQDDFGVLCKATTSKLKCFTKALGDPSLFNAPSYRVALEKFGNNKGIRIRSCLSSVVFPFSYKIKKMALYLYSAKLKVGSKYLYLTWSAFEHQVRKTSLTL
jgi:hypothetical protein